MRLFSLLIVVFAFNFWPSQGFAQTEERENRRDHTADTNSLSAEGTSTDCSRIDDIALTDNTVASSSTSSGGGTPQDGQGIK